MVDTSYVGRALPPTPPYGVGREKIREFALAIGEGASVCHDLDAARGAGHPDLVGPPPPPPPPRAPPASVCHDLDAARGAGHPDLVAPPTFTIAVVLPVIERFLRDPALGWDYSRMVHADQSIVLHRPVHAGDELVTTIHVEDLTTRAGSHLLKLRCEVADAAGGPVATTHAMLVTQAEAA